ncbi:MAG: TadE/TadG family type IV pilus assembly protein [Novosphingobium sp.]
MNGLRALLTGLGHDEAGSTVIETALVLPPLLALSLGSFEVSRMVARQSELQKAANEASDIVRAATPDTSEKRQTIKSVVEASTGLQADKVTMSLVYRCGTNADFVTATANCSGSGGSTEISAFIKIVMVDTYTPLWNNYGFGNAMTYTVTRYVQIG